MRHLGKALVAVALASTAANAQILNFEGINSTYPSTNYAFLQNYYNGGTSSQGTSGTNFGIEFSSNAQAICLNTILAGQLQSCSNTSRGGVGNAGSQRGGLFFLSGSATFMNRSAGFTNGFSFFYAAISSGGSFSVWSGLNGTGTLLGSLNLATTPSNCPGFSAGFCPFVAAGLAFSGTAQSVTFAGVANQIVFDDVTFGNSVPDQPPGDNVVPEPATYVMMGTGLVMLGGIARRRRNTAV
jgi:PEP-CTERM motif